MLTSIHVLLTYVCNYECDHCFLYCSPRAVGTFTLSKMRDLINQANDLGTIKSFYFEGGEPFLFYPLLAKSLELARENDFSTGIVSNCYWALTQEDAALWLDPIKGYVNDLSLSDDAFHFGSTEESPAAIAVKAAASLKIPTRAICIKKPDAEQEQDAKGEPVVGGKVLFKGRAVETMTKGLPTLPVESFMECPHEELAAPRRVHVDPFGYVHLCQGVCIGNLFESPLVSIMEEYNPANHPICGPLLKGGPAELVKTHNVDVGAEFVDECHCCFLVRKALVDRFPESLAPRQVFGLEQN
jgi:MoaA/NifB/PqqE/SkfB family radical SAM enzyme